MVVLWLKFIYLCATIVVKITLGTDYNAAVLEVYLDVVCDLYFWDPEDPI